MPESPDHRFADLVPVAEDAEQVEVAWRHACVREDVEVVEDDRVELGARGLSGFVAERSPARVTFILTDPPEDDALVHPMLTIPISIFARWRGDVTLHAGAFEAAGTAWAVIGEREAGKSTMLASLAQHGYPIVADDLLAIQDRQVWAGPRCVDLRADVAERFPGTRPIGTVARRPRHRLPTPPGRTRLPVGGLFVLGWHDGPGVEVTEIELQERLKLLYRQEYIALVGGSPAPQLLELLAMPAWRVRRPRSWEATEAVIETLTRLAADHA